MARRETPVAHHAAYTPRYIIIIFITINKEKRKETQEM